ncbi:MAG TPA: HAMP domain-containing sensor histidine kinase, partial [Chthonomonadales bacterium]|nr:HAMP domain-containing sensor histidine kinase [Chthonomonadales bacterium]
MITSGRAAGAGKRSLRTQLIVSNVLLLALLLMVFGVLARYAAQSYMMRSVDSDLFRRTMPPPPPGGIKVWMGPPPDGGPPGPRGLGPVTPAPPPGAIGNWPAAGPFPPGGMVPDLTAPQPGLPGSQPPFQGAPVRIAGVIQPPRPVGGPDRPVRYDRAGRPLDPFDTRPPWDRSALEQALSGRIVYTTVKQNGGLYRVISRPLPSTGPPLGAVQAAYPLEDVYRALSGLTAALLLLIPIGIVGAAAAAVLITNRVLGRVRLATEAAAQIGATELSRRLPVSGADEFSLLARTFNRLLDRMETAFRSQERALEQQRRFTADASHEMKTPLTVIKGAASSALNTPGLPERYREATKEIDQAADRMSHLVQDLLLLARSDSGQLGRNPVEILVREVLERAISATPNASGVPVALELAEDSLTVIGNEAELERLFINLLENAVRHTPVNGSVRLRAQASGIRVRVQVTDTGSGIPAEALPHLGERFFRADSSRSRTDGGAGLGLSIC